jgi:hypothetical protein
MACGISLACGIYSMACNWFGLHYAISLIDIYIFVILCDMLWSAMYSVLPLFPSESDNNIVLVYIHSVPVSIKKTYGCTFLWITSCSILIFLSMAYTLCCSENLLRNWHIQNPTMGTGLSSFSVFHTLIWHGNSEGITNEATSCYRFNILQRRSHVSHV